MNNYFRYGIYCWFSYSLKALLLTVYLGDGVVRFAEFMIILALGPFALPLPFFGHLTPPLWTWYPVILWWIGSYVVYEEVVAE